MPAIVTVNVSLTVAPAPLTLQSSGALISCGATSLSASTSSLLTQLSDLTPLLKGALANTSITYSTGVATVTTAAPHGLVTGDVEQITISGATPTIYNGVFNCTITGASTFTYPLVANPGGSASPAGSYTLEDVAELLAMATTFFAQGSNQGVFVLELGALDVTDAVAVLTTYIASNPNSAYTAGAQGYFYAYLTPRTWDGNAAFLSMLASFEATTAQTYFYVTTTLQNYALYTNLMKCVFALIEAPAMGNWPANVISGATWSSADGGQITFTTTTAHTVAVGQWFQITGMTPAGYNGWFRAVLGTTGSTLIAYAATDPGSETIFGTLLANNTVQAAIPVLEFSCACALQHLLSYNPSPVNKVAPFAFAFVFGVTPFPTKSFNSLLTTLKAAATNVIGTGAEGGISIAIILWGQYKDGNDVTYWYSVDWVQQNVNQAISNAIINGSNNPQNPLYYNQDGINRLQAVAQQVMSNGVSFGLVFAGLTTPTVTAIPFATYVVANPSDYPIGKYAGLAVIYTPARGFIQIIFNVQVTSFPTA